MARFKYHDYWLPKYRKKELKKAVKANPADYDCRKVRNRIRENMRNPEWIKQHAQHFPKLGAFVSTMYRSSGRFRAAYSHARSEAEFYYIARYADY